MIVVARNKISFIEIMSYGVVVAMAVLLFFFMPASSENLKMCLSWICAITSIMGFVHLAKKTKSIISQYVFFWVMFCVFTVGQVYLNCLNIDFVGNVYDRFSTELINRYLLYATLSMVMMIVASNRFIPVENDCEPLMHSQPIERSLKIVAFFMFVLSAPFYVSELTKSISAVYLSGYGEIYEIGGSSISASFAMLFIPSLFLLIYLYKNKGLRYVFLGIALFAALGTLYLGTRSRPMAIIVCLLYLWFRGINRSSKRNILIVAFVGLVCLLLIPQVYSVRSISGRSISDLFSLSNLFTNIGNSISSAIGEMGGSMQIWLRLQHIIPEKQGYSFGFSYLAAILSCIPSFLMGGFSFAKYANLSVWITNIENANYGLGFSTLGESYYNFGWFGIITIYFVSGFIFYALSAKWCKNELEEYKIPFSAISLYIFATTARGAMYLSIRSIVYCILIPILLVHLMTYRSTR